MQKLICNVLQLEIILYLPFLVFVYMYIVIYIAKIYCFQYIKPFFFCLIDAIHVYQKMLPSSGEFAALQKNNLISKKKKSEAAVI